VEQLGTDARQVAGKLIANFGDATPGVVERNTGGLGHGSLRAYGLLPRPDDRGAYTLPMAYVERAVRDVTLQLSRAGARLALVLNKALSGPP
jgi:nuclease S1